MTRVRHILVAASLLLALATAPAFAQTTANTATTKSGGFSNFFSSSKSSTKTATAGNIADINKSRTQRHIHTYLPRNYSHRSMHVYNGQKNKTGGASAATPASSSGGFFGRFKKSGTSQ